MSGPYPVTHDFCLLPFWGADFAGVLELLAAAMPGDPISEARFTRQVLLDPSFRAEGALVAKAGGRTVGFCLAVAPACGGAAMDERGYVTLLAVGPEARRRGVGSALLERAEAFLRSEGRTRCLVSPYPRGYFLPGVDVAAYPEALAFFRSRGYEEVSQPLSMEIALHARTQPRTIAECEARLAREGVIVEAYRPELTLPALELLSREFGEDWVRIAREAMAELVEGRGLPSRSRSTSGSLARRVFLARRGDEGLGCVHTQGSRFGPIGVAKEARGQGIGSALTLRALESMREAGLPKAWFLWTDDRTAERLYRPLGFREARRFAVLAKEL